jgi:hypothetical protein
VVLLNTRSGIAWSPAVWLALLALSHAGDELLELTRYGQTRARVPGGDRWCVTADEDAGPCTYTPRWLLAAIAGTLAAVLL